VPELFDIFCKFLTKQNFGDALAPPAAPQLLHHWLEQRDVAVNAVDLLVESITFYPIFWQWEKIRLGSTLKLYLKKYVTLP